MPIFLSVANTQIFLQIKCDHLLSKDDRGESFQNKPEKVQCASIIGSDA